MAEEQDDPCLIVLDLGEDEEEPSPEFGVPGLGIPGVRNILQGVVPGAEILSGPILSRNARPMYYPCPEAFTAEGNRDLWEIFRRFV